MFKNRIDAGTQLSKRLLKFKKEHVVILAIPRGGLPIGAIIAKALNAPLDVALSKKIGHPLHSEYAIGAVNLEDVILTDTVGIKQEYIDQEVDTIRTKLKELHQQYYNNRKPLNLKDKTVIIVDDGIATGNTIFATIALKSKEKPEKIIVAVPVAPSSAIRKLKNHPRVDEVICLQEPFYFKAVGQFYEVFDQVSNKDAIGFYSINY